MKLLREKISDTSVSCSEQRMYIEGIFMQGELVNANGRLYPISILEKAVRDYTNQSINSGRSVGELNHPDSPNINFERACIKTTSLVRDGNNIYGKAMVLSTPLGMLVQSLVNDGVKIGVSSRGVGSIKKDKGVDVVEDDFVICAAADVVSDPSAPDAFVNHVFESKEWIIENGIFKPSTMDTAIKTVKQAKGKGVDLALRIVAESLIRELRSSRGGFSQ